MGGTSLIISDVHGNLAALEAVLQAEKNWDEVLFLGDASHYGPHPDKVLSLLSELNALCIMGNHDEEILEVDLNQSFTHPDRRLTQWSRGQISPDNLHFLTTFRRTAVLRRQGLSIRLIHGTLPAHQGKWLWPDSEPSIYAYLENQHPEEIILLGHSHVQFKRKGSRALFINPGGVGQQRLGQTLACYAVLEDSRVALRAVEYDKQRTATEMGRIDFEDRDLVRDWQRAYLEGILPSRYRIRDLSPLRRMGYR